MHSRRLYACVVAAILAVASVAVLIAKDSLNIRLRDDCDPATFNADPPAGVGPGTCVGDGDTALADFRAEFGQTGQVEKWRFNNDHADVDRGTAITVTNRGGETHTFTRVAEFGGGFVPPLNGLPDGGQLTLAPECAAAPGVPQPPGENNLFVPAGASMQTPRLTSRGTVKFQCCIHPWMHSEITVK